MQNGLSLLRNPDRSVRPKGERMRWGASITSLLLSIPVLLATGCDSGAGSKPPVSGSTAVSAPGQTSLSAGGQALGITDPLSEITDKNDPRYIRQPVKPLLHARGTGPSQFQLRAGARTRSVRVYIACAPASSFNATVGKGFSGNCARRFQNFADIPVRPGELGLEVRIPEATHFVVVVIPTPKDNG